MKSLLLPSLILFLFLFNGCATRSGHFPDGKEYAEYDVLFDKDRGRFYVPLKWTKEQKEYEYSDEDVPVPVLEWADDRGN